MSFRVITLDFSKWKKGNLRFYEENVKRENTGWVQKLMIIKPSQYCPVQSYLKWLQCIIQYILYSPCDIQETYSQSPSESIKVFIFPESRTPSCFYLEAKNGKIIGIGSYLDCLCANLFSSSTKQMLYS